MLYELKNYKKYYFLSKRNKRNLRRCTRKCFKVSAASMLTLKHYRRLAAFEKNLEAPLRGQLWAGSIERTGAELQNRLCTIAELQNRRATRVWTA